jgi:hypothetical protein
VKSKIVELIKQEMKWWLLVAGEDMEGKGNVGQKDTKFQLNRS